MDDLLAEKPYSLSEGAKTAAISLALDDYEDIFSDFDPRPYSQRMLSEDFLRELKRACQHWEEDGLTMTLILPKEKRVPAHEKVILERLKDHFRRNHRRLQEKRKTDQRTGFKMVALGVVFMLTSTYLLTAFPQTLWRSFVVVLLEPAGWFTFWEGSSMVLFYSKEATPDLDFYRKMAGAKTTFAAITVKPPEKPRP